MATLNKILENSETNVVLNSLASSNLPPIIRAVILANTKYKYFEGHDHYSDEVKIEWAKTKETTIAALVQVFSCLVTEPI